MPTLYASSPRILIIKPSSLGDIIHTLPLLKTLRSAFPSAFIAWVVEEAFQEILAGETDLNEIITVRTRKWRREANLKSLKEIGHTIKRMRGGRFDIALDLQGLVKSGVMAWLSRAATRIGFHKSDMREPFSSVFINTMAERAKPGQHAIERGLGLLQPMGIKEFKYCFGLKVSGKDAETAANFFNGQISGQSLVAVNPGFGFRTKAWRLERYAVLADKLMEELNCSVLLTWGPGEREMVDSISGMMKKKPLIPPPTTINQSAAFFNHCDLFIGSDTGPMHLCAALGVRSLVLMGSTDPLRNGPFGEGHVVIQKDLPCRNCYKRKCPTNLECMDAIQVGEVFDAASKILAHISSFY